MNKDVIAELEKEGHTVLVMNCTRTKIGVVQPTIKQKPWWLRQVKKQIEASILLGRFHSVTR